VKHTMHNQLVIWGGGGRGGKKNNREREL